MTSAQLTPLALGCEALGGTDWGTIDAGQARDAVRCALECGITVFDTADAYGLGRSEEELSRALAEDRHRVTIVTKGGISWSAPPAGDRAATRRDASARYLKSAIECSLKRLRIDVIPLYLVHWPDPQTPLEETLNGLEEARLTGRILAYGLSNFAFSDVKAALKLAGIEALEGPLSLLSPDSVLREYAEARSAALTTLTYGPLAQGLLTGKYSPAWVFEPTDRRHRLDHFSSDAFDCNRHVLEALARVSRELDRSPAQVALRWVLDTAVATCVIVGAKSPSQVLDNHAAQSWTLGATQRDTLNKARELAGLATAA